MPRDLVQFPEVETLPSTAQEIFDTVVRHLAAQGHQSLSSVGCAYRGENGDKCAVGVLIFDWEYTPSMEGKGSEFIDLPLRLRPHKELLALLQAAHDTTMGAVDLRDGLQGIATSFSLSTETLDETIIPSSWPDCYPSPEAKP